MRVLSPTFNSPRNTRLWSALATSEGHEVWGDARYVLSNPRLEDGVRFVRVILFNQPLGRQACIDHHGPVHAHPSVSASLVSRASRIKSVELPGRGLPPNISCRSSAKSSWSGLSDNSPAMPLASSFVNSRSIAAWQYPRMLTPLSAAVAFKRH